MYLDIESLSGHSYNQDHSFQICHHEQIFNKAAHKKAKYLMQIWIQMLSKHL